MAELHTLNPSTQKLESYRYPLVDTKNATSVLKLLEITTDDTNKVGEAKHSRGVADCIIDITGDDKGQVITILKLVHIPLTSYIGKGTP